MIHHIDLAVADIARSREFYMCALAPLGFSVVTTFTNYEGRQLIGFGSPPDPAFWIRNGEPLRGRAEPDDTVRATLEGTRACTNGGLCYALSMTCISARIAQLFRLQER